MVKNTYKSSTSSEAALKEKQKEVGLSSKLCALLQGLFTKAIMQYILLPSLVTTSCKDRNISIEIPLPRSLGLCSNHSLKSADNKI